MAVLLSPREAWECPWAMHTSFVCEADFAGFLPFAMPIFTRCFSNYEQVVGRGWMCLFSSWGCPGGRWWFAIRPALIPGGTECNPTTWALFTSLLPVGGARARALAGAHVSDDVPADFCVLSRNEGVREKNQVGHSKVVWYYLVKSIGGVGWDSNR